MVRPYQTEIPPNLASVIRSMHPELKRFVRAGLESIAANPESGEPLQGKLRRYWKYGVRRFRIIYAIDRTKRTIRVVAIAHRRAVYEELAARLRQQGS